ncbi:hypothetical protein ZWY2020_013101 [Hordeum vulgare]|nr:hypothetical protein ZWY2020_013101 [Hordeum vulgare]
MARFQETKPDLSNSGSDTRMMGEARLPKARKPYMITKQREKWTEEEHRLFLEAMQLHGRAWRRIQEHIGTKTAVQIRSHAQKFFSKVTRDSSGDSGGNTSSGAAGPPIQIPPPRPKRKSVHPYPCNLRSAQPGKHAHALLRVDRPRLSMCEQGNGSPTSVVTTSRIALGSESFDSDTSTIDIEEPCPTPSTGTADVAVQAPPTDDDAKRSKDSGSNSEEVVCDNTSDAPVLKLFGKTVVVNPGTCNLQTASDMELDTSAETPTSAPEAKTWSPWLANSQQFMYYVPQGAVFFSYNNGSAPNPMPSSPKADQQHQQQASEAAAELRRREASSNTASSSVAETTARNSAESCTGAVGGDDEMSHAAGLRKPVSPTFVQQRGFMPYKRCAAETRALLPQAPREEADREMTRLCL